MSMNSHTPSFDMCTNFGISRLSSEANMDCPYLLTQAKIMPTATMRS